MTTPDVAPETTAASFAPEIMMVKIRVVPSNADIVTCSCNALPTFRAFTAALPLFSA